MGTPEVAPRRGAARTYGFRCPGGTSRTESPSWTTANVEVPVEREELLLLLQAAAATVGRACAAFATDQPGDGARALRRQGLFLAWLANAATARTHTVRLASLIAEERQTLADELAHIASEASRERRATPDFANDVLDAERLTRLLESHEWASE